MRANGIGGRRQIRAGRLKECVARTIVCVGLFLLSFLQIPMGLAQADSSLARLTESFAHPPDDCRIMMRWWWFGPGVTKPEIQRELEQMKAAGIGGVEITTLYPLALDDPQTGFHNLSYLSDEHIDDLRFAVAEARKLGMRVDITLGSGWPFGGPHIPVTQAAGEMRVEAVAIPTGAHSIAIPSVAAGEQLIAGFWVPGLGDELAFNEAKQVSLPAMENGRLQISLELDGPHTAVFFISSRTGMIVKRAAVGAEGFVLDHYDRNAIETHLHAVGDRLLEAFGGHPTYAVFSDSLEDYGSDWTGDLLQQFHQRRGYDLTPHLPALIGDAGPETPAVRHDWGKTLTELANENYLVPLHAWAQQHHTLFRSQTYGFPPVNLSSNQYEDLPEGEGKATLLMWRQFSDTRWAASAGHLFDRPVISSETWTWLHSPAFRATPLDIKAEADLHFLQGINQLVGHGWPYSPQMAGEPGWRMHAAGAFNAHNPWWFAMPDLAEYLQRVSFALRQGKPANDVALLLPNDDAWATFTVTRGSSASVTTKGGFNTRGENVSIDESMQKLLGNNVIPQILDAGFNLDFIDGDAIDALGIQYPVLVLPGVERLPLATYRKIEQYALHGGIVIATRRLPSTAPGLLNAESESRQIQEISQRLFRDKGAVGHFVEDESQLGAVAAGHIKPDVIFLPKTPEIGFIHRRLSDGDLYFIANTSNQPRIMLATFRQAAKYAEWWDPFTGTVMPIENPAKIDVSLQPYESRLIYFTNSVIKPETVWISDRPSQTIDLSSDWNLTFNGLNQTIHMATLHSWNQEETYKYYSGQVAYEKEIDLPAVSSSDSPVLDFGEGTPVAKPEPLPTFNLRAYLEGPVREAAEVFVNGKRAGLVWHPPYTIDLTSLLKPGKNKLRIVVGNTAINSLAGRALPGYRLLNDRYGERFIPQGMENLQPLPSGLLGGLRLKITPRHVVPASSDSH
ncbi:MAG: glycosyl hydrolase [Candidatus Sulfotelmatobacter sp.]